MFCFILSNNPVKRPLEEMENADNLMSPLGQSVALFSWLQWYSGGPVLDPRYRFKMPQ